MVMTRMRYSRLRGLQVVAPAAVVVLLLAAADLSWPVTVGTVLPAVALGYWFGAGRWEKARARIDKRNVLIVYYNETWFYALLIVLYSFKSFPFLAGWAAFRVYTYVALIVSTMLLLGGFWLGHAFAFLQGAISHEKRHGPIRPRFFHSRSVTGQEGMIGLTGRVTRPCAPDGKVAIRAEIWDAVSIDGDEIPAGETVIVRDIEEMRLVVEKGSGLAS